MYLLTKFDGVGVDRLNAMLDTANGILNRYVCLIASSCYPFPEVLQAKSYPLDCVPFEGFGDVRYFPGKNLVQEIEEYGNQLLRSLLPYETEYRATLQPHSGTQANQIAYNATLAEGDVVLSMDPNHGGHISHRILIGRRNKVIHYGLDSTGFIDYEEVDCLLREHKPKLLIAGGSAYPRKIDFARLAKSAKDVNALFLTDLAHTMLYQCSQHHESVFPHADFVTFTPEKNMRGPGGGILIYRKEFERKIGPAVFPGTQGGPHIDLMFAKVVGLHRLVQTDISNYASHILDNARAMCEAFSAREIPVVTGGTDCHIVLLDLRKVGVSGLEVEVACEKERLLVNRNLVAGDIASPRVTSGLRLGSACISILGASRTESAKLANAVADCIQGRPQSARDAVEDFTLRFMRGLVSPVR